MNIENPTGWVKPQRKRSLEELKTLIAEKRAELAVLEQEEFNLIEGPRLEALAQIRNIMRAQQITVADLLAK